MKKFGKLTIMKKIYLAIFFLCTVFFSVTLAGSTYSRKQLEKDQCSFYGRKQHSE